MTAMRTEKRHEINGVIEVNEEWEGLPVGRYLFREPLFIGERGVAEEVREALRAGRAAFSTSAADLAGVVGAAPSVRLWPPPFGRRLTLTFDQLQQIVDEAVMRHVSVTQGAKS